eukprot:gene23155-17542_t
MKSDSTKEASSTVEALDIEQPDDIKLLSNGKLFYGYPRSVWI